MFHTAVYNLVLSQPLFLLPCTVPCMIIFTMSHLLSLKLHVIGISFVSTNDGRRLNFVLSSFTMLAIVRSSIQLICPQPFSFFLSLVRFSNVYFP